MTDEINFMVNLHKSMGPGGDQTCDPGSAVRRFTDCANGPSSGVISFKN